MKTSFEVSLVPFIPGVARSDDLEMTGGGKRLWKGTASAVPLGGRKVWASAPEAAIFRKPVPNRTTTGNQRSERAVRSW